MIRVGICDDEVLFCAQLNKELDIYSFQNAVDLEISIFHDIDELKGTELQLDILFLDIRFGNQDHGIEGAFTIRQKQKHCLIIFLSSLQQYMPEGYKVRAFRFLVKPISKLVLNETMTDALAYMGQDDREETFLKIRTLSGNAMVTMDDIIAIQSLPAQRVRQVYLEGAETIYTKEILKDFTERLPEKKFVMVHKCYIIHCTHVKSVQHSVITMKNGLKINLTRVYKDDFWLCQNKFIADGRRHR